MLKLMQLAWWQAICFTDDLRRRECEACCPVFHAQPCLPLCVFTTEWIAGWKFCQTALKICISSGIITHSWQKGTLNDWLFWQWSGKITFDRFFYVGASETSTGRRGGWLSAFVRCWWNQRPHFVSAWFWIAHGNKILNKSRPSNKALCLESLCIQKVYDPP